MPATAPKRPRTRRSGCCRDQPDLVGGTGSWLSSFTLAVTEVTERAQLPWLTLSAIPTRSPIAASNSSSRPRRPPTGRRRRRCRPRSSWREARDRQAAEDDRHHHGQHRLAGQLRQAAARGRAREGRAQAGRRPDLHAAAVGRDAADREGALGQARFPAAADLGDAGLQAGARKARRVQARRTARSRWSATARRSARPNC